MEEQTQFAAMTGDQREENWKRLMDSEIINIIKRWETRYEEAGLMRDDAWDAMQEIISRILLKRSAEVPNQAALYDTWEIWKSPEHARNYLNAAMRNEKINIIRKRKRESLVAAEILEKHKADLTEDAFQHSVEAQRKRWLYEGIFQLPPTLAAVALLRAKEYTFKEIAEILEIEENTAIKRWSRAKEALKESLATLKRIK